MANPDTIGTGGLVAALIGAVGWLAKRYDDARKAEIASIQKHCDDRIVEYQVEADRARASLAALQIVVDERTAKIERLSEARESENRRLSVEVAALRQRADHLANGTANGTGPARTRRAAHPRRPGPADHRQT